MKKIFMLAAVTLISSVLINNANAQNCKKEVIVKFYDPGHFVEYQVNPEATFTGVNPFKNVFKGSYVGGYTSGKGPLSTVVQKGKGCNQKIVVDWKWARPFKVVIRPSEVVGKCVTQRTYRHELEHVDIFINTPKEYANKIKNKLSTSNNPKADMLQIRNEIVHETNRRHKELDVRYVYAMSRGKNRC